MPKMKVSFSFRLLFRPPPIDSLFDLLWLTSVTSVMINVLVMFGKSAVMSTRCSRKGAALSAVSSLGGLYKVTHLVADLVGVTLI